MQSITTEQARKVEAYTNTVGALSDIAFSNLERLTALNQELARAALHECLAASNDLLAVRNMNALPKMQQSATNPALAQFADYIYGVQNIATESQKRIGNVLNAYFGTLGMSSTADANIQAGFDFLSKLAGQTREMVAANVEATRDAGNKIATAVTPSPKKAA